MEALGSSIIDYELISCRSWLMMEGDQRHGELMYPTGEGAILVLLGLEAAANAC